MTNNTHTGAVIVTGASSGIGHAVCTRLLEEGYEVIGVSRSIDTARYANDRFTALACDLRDFAQTGKKLTAELKNRRHISAVVFCAGTGYFGSLEQLEFKKIQQLLELNLLSPIYMSKMLVPFFKRKGYGRMVFIGSEAAIKGTKNGTAYCASKFGLRGFVQGLNAECRQAGLGVSLINPGMVRTPFFDELHFQPGKDVSNAIAPEVIADSVAYLLSVDRHAVIDEINLSPRNRVIEFK